MFIKDEHLFFEDLIKSYTLALIAPEKFSDNKALIDALNRSQKRNNLLIEAIKVHNNDLKIMVDGIDQPNEEKAYRKSHKGLILKIKEFQDSYKVLKSQLFDIFKKIKKDDKQQHLLGNK